MGGEVSRNYFLTLLFAPCYTQLHKLLYVKVVSIMSF